MTNFMKNLNKELIISDQWHPVQGSIDEPLKNFSVSVQNPTFDNVEVIFKDIENRLINLINKHNNGAIFGCVAWLTSSPILTALSKCKAVQIIVQKEDFLRPDLQTKNKWKEDLRILYDEIKCPLVRYQFKEPIQNLSYGSGCENTMAIRCVGNHNSDKSPAFPRAHHKFLVFCECDDIKLESNHYREIKYKPIAVWTGSFNFTKNATYSFENAIYIEDKSGENELINAYLKEHHQIFCLSEDLDWKEDWITPEFRLGS